MEPFKNFDSLFKCSSKNHQGNDETCSCEDHHRKGRPRVSSAAEDEFIRVNCTSDCSPNKCFRVQVTDTSQHQLFGGDSQSGLHGQSAAKKPLLKDTKNKKRLAWAKEHEQWTLDRWKSVLWSDASKIEIFGSNRRVCEMQSKQRDNLCMCGSHHEAWRRRCDGLGFLCW